MRLRAGRFDAMGAEVYTPAACHVRAACVVARVLFP